MMKAPANNKLIPAAAVLVSAVLAGALLVHFMSRPADTTSSTDLPSASLAALAPEAASANARALRILRFNRQAALDEALRELDPQKRGIAFGRLLALWLDEDMEGALAFVKGMPQGAQYNEGLFMVLECVLKSDPERAVTLAGEMATTGEQRHIYSALFAQIAQRDMNAALNLLELTPTGEGRDNALRAIASAWSDKDVNAALNWAQTLGDTNERNAVIETSLISLARQDPQQALTLAGQSLGGGALERVVATSLKQMIQDNPQSVSELINDLPAGELQTQVTLDVARALAAQQPETALEWLQSLPSGELRQAALNNVLDLWNRQSPADAALYVSQIPAGDDQDAAVSHLSLGYGAANPAAAMQWAETLPSDSARTTAVVNIVSGWAENDPAAATLWAQNLTPDNPARLEALRGAYTYWVLEDANAAGNFAGTLPKAELAQLTDR